jgi:cation transport regulator ChaB
MPYTSNSELPKAVRSKLSEHQQDVFRNVFNSMMGEDGMTESRAFAGAWSKSKQVKKTDEVEKAEYEGKQVKLDKPFRLPAGSSKKFGVYVKDGDKVVKVTFGDPNMEIRRDNPDARAAFRSRHSCDTATDKTSARYWSCRMWDDDQSVSELTKNIQGQILKADTDQRMVWGWASVISENGVPVVDTQGDVIKAETLVKAATEFMLSTRVTKEMHFGDKVGEFIHSLPLTKDLAESLGIKSDKEGWIVACKVYDDAVWEKVKSGELRAFSIGGRAKREKINE